MTRDVETFVRLEDWRFETRRQGGFNPWFDQSLEVVWTETTQQSKVTITERLYNYEEIQWYMDVLLFFQDPEMIDK